MSAAPARALALLAAIAFAGCDGGEPTASLSKAVERAAERAASRSARRIKVGSRDDERWRPEAALPRYHWFPRDEIAALERYRTGCRDAPGSVSPSLRKALEWARFRCKDAPLPPGFFANAPYLHPDGHSFAWHARECDDAACADGRAPELFHVLERGEMDPTAYPHLDRPALGRLLAGERFALAGDEIAVRSGGAYALVSPVAVAAEEPRVEPGDAEHCDARALDHCWVDRAARRSSSYARLAVRVSALLALLALVAVAIWRVRLGRRLAAERVFVLRWLAHELRTPVTAMKLEVEGLRDDFDALPPRAQDHFLTLAREVARLSRVVEASAVYLRSEARGGEAPKRVGSVRDFVETAVSEATDAEIAIDAQDEPATIPVHATALALRNLVRNAVQHGAAPCSVRVEADAHTLRFSVSDAGELPEETIRALGAPFAQGHRAGLGLGLYLAHHAATALGGGLEVTRQPTRFSFRVPRGAP